MVKARQSLSWPENPARRENDLIPKLHSVSFYASSGKNMDILRKGWLIAPDTTGTISANSSVVKRAHLSPPCSISPVSLAKYLLFC